MRPKGEPVQETGPGPGGSGVAQHAGRPFAWAPAAGRWMGPPMQHEQGRTFFTAFHMDSQEYRLGDAVYLRPAQPDLPLFVAKLESLYQQDSDGSCWANVRWFYRPSELEVGHEVELDRNELFGSDDYATHPLSAVCGKCKVLAPAQADRTFGSSVAEPGSDTFVCSRKYISAEGRIVRLDGMAGLSLTAALQEKPGTSVKEKVVQREPAAEDKAAAEPRPKRARSAAAVASAGAQPAPEPPSSKRRRQPNAAGRPPEHAAQPTGGADAAAAPLAPVPAQEGGSSGSEPQQSSGSQESPGTGGDVGRGGPTKANSKGTTGRWSKDRYGAAQQSLAGIMRHLGATAVDRAVRRPLLREEARRAVGDTGLLDHLLKHKADHVVSAGGERLRRRHDKEGHMVYWLQSPAEAEQEEELLRTEAEALSRELAGVKEARRVLHAVRGEAAQAIQAVSGIKERPEEVVRALSAAVAAAASYSTPTPRTSSPETAGSPVAALLGAHAGALAAGLLAPQAAAPGPPPAGPPACRNELLQLIAAVESQAQALQARLLGEEGPARKEGKHGEAAHATRLLCSQMAAQLASLARVARAVNARCAALEAQVAALAAEGRGRQEALTAGVAAAKSLREEAAASRIRVASMEGDIAALRVKLTGMGGTVVPDPPALMAAAGGAARGAAGASPAGAPPLQAGGGGSSQTTSRRTPATPSSLDAVAQAAAAPQQRPRVVRNVDPFQPRQQQLAAGMALGTPPKGQGGLPPLSHPVGALPPVSLPASPLLHGSGVLPVPGMTPVFGSVGGVHGGTPRGGPTPLHLQQQLIAAAAMATAAQAAQGAAGRPPQEALHQEPQLSGAGASQEAGASGEPQRAQQPPPQLQPPQRQAQQPGLASVLMQDPRFAQVLMQLQQQAGSSVASGSTSRLRPPGRPPADAPPSPAGKGS